MHLFSKAFHTRALLATILKFVENVFVLKSSRLCLNSSGGIGSVWSVISDKKDTLFAKLTKIMIIQLKCSIISLNAIVVCNKRQISFVNMSFRFFLSKIRSYLIILNLVGNKGQEKSKRNKAQTVIQLSSRLLHHQEDHQSLRNRNQVLENENVMISKIFKDFHKSAKKKSKNKWMKSIQKQKNQRKISR